MRNANISVNFRAADPFDAVVKKPRELLLFDAQRRRSASRCAGDYYADATQVFFCRRRADRLLPRDKTVCARILWKQPLSDIGRPALLVAGSLAAQNRRSRLLSAQAGGIRINPENPDRPALKKISSRQGDGFGNAMHACISGAAHNLRSLHATAASGVERRIGHDAA